MDSHFDVVSSPFSIGVKGRVVLPVAIRRAAHIGEGEQVVARPDGEGRIVIETVASIRARVWAAAPQPGGLDVTEDVRTMRGEDDQVSDEAAARRGDAGSDVDSATAGAKLLAHLGL